jgi:hypothetical protein
VEIIIAAAIKRADAIYFILLNTQMVNVDARRGADEGIMIPSDLIPARKLFRDSKMTIRTFKAYGR